ncbi:hypothetical protein CpecG_0441 [Chlamydia pecorum MC/MarsBar]|nr:hypothetical protein CpecS_0445 [Chlamydia pecorum VR629]ETF39341.1 hypothetical protein CpecF_0441 [Chlamydia pecorum DBDeUG]ETF40016.1 hypothetical protein CpecG_0441 [Chlamydia pecorum MC/MarsBar]
MKIHVLFLPPVFLAKIQAIPVDLTNLHAQNLVGEIKDNNKAHRLKAVHLLTVAADSKGRPYLFT